MKKSLILILGIAISFCSGFAFNKMTSKQSNSKTNKMKKVTGIGGIFFKCKDPNKLRELYNTHLGLETNKYGATLNGGRLMIRQKEVLHNGALSRRRQNILSRRPNTL